MKSYDIGNINVKSIVSGDYIQLLTTNTNISYVSCQIWWSGFDVFDGNIQLALKRSSNAPYLDIPTLYWDIDNETGSNSGTCILTCQNYFGYAIGIKIDKGTATTGNININVLVND